MNRRQPFSPGRRKLLTALAGAGAVAGVAWLRPGEIDGGHNAYFRNLQQAVRSAGLARPTLVIDRERLDHNLQTLLTTLDGQYAYRIVAKSLPSIPLLAHLMEAGNTRRLMVFHQPFLNQVAEQLPQSDVLLGKPMPVAGAEKFYRDWAAGSRAMDPARQIQWLIDTPERLSQYHQLARQTGQRLRISLEIDIGLHRGGFPNPSALDPVLAEIESSDHLELAGFMGYEPHIAKAPGPASWHRDRAMSQYRAFVEHAEAQLGRSLRDLTLNTGGSSTYTLYPHATNVIANEIAAGSALVKPTDFDLPNLAHHQPAAFIATPVLKVTDTEIPAAPGLAALMALWNPNRSKAVFIYGGYWKARPVSPPGLSPNPVYGRSTNQEMLNASSGNTLIPDDRVFLRPTQSEKVLLNFGSLAVFSTRSGAVTGFWPVLTNG